MNGQQGRDPAQLAATLVTIAALDVRPHRFVAGATPSPRSSRRLTSFSPSSTPTATCPPTLAYDNVSHDTNEAAAANPTYDFTGAVALVTGASSGIGL